VGALAEVRWPVSKEQLVREDFCRNRAARLQSVCVAEWEVEPAIDARNSGFLRGG
jgi:hypothetical protein